VAELERKLSRTIPYAHELIGGVILAGAQVFGDSIYNSAPISPRGVLSGRNAHSRGELKRSIKRGQMGRRRSDNVQSAFAAVDRKAAPQGRWLYQGTRRQPPRHEYFDTAVSSARGAARAEIRAGLLSLVEKLERA
jgi:hypothetical protein